MIYILVFIVIHIIALYLHKLAFKVTMNPVIKMNIEKIREQLDNYYQNQQMDQGYQFLMQQLQEAMQKQDDILVLGLLNELLGYCRVAGKTELGKNIANKADVLVQSLQLQNQLIGATTYLNIATFYSIHHELTLAEKYYQKVMTIYIHALDPYDERIASLYNNMSIFYHETNKYHIAYHYQQLAIKIIETLPNSKIEEATSYTNLAQICLSLQKDQEAYLYLQKSIMLFTHTDIQDPHYISTLSILANYYFRQKKYQKSITIYDEALQKMETLYGKNTSYDIIKQNQQFVIKEFTHFKQSTLYLCKQYYLEVARDKIQQTFPYYFSRMAIGLVGYGSECLGFDDCLSTDHDFGPGFCIWLTDEDYDAIGNDLQQLYDQLPKTYHGYTRITSKHGDGRVGVFKIKDFYYQFVGEIPYTPLQWIHIPVHGLMLATNGLIFEDSLQEFTKIRQHLLQYYPEDVRIKKIVTQIAKMAQSGQYNYARLMQRQEYVASEIAITEFMEACMACIYLLNRCYYPFYKWMHHGLVSLPLLSAIADDLTNLALLPNQRDAWHQDHAFYQTHINTEDKKVVLIEKICQAIIKELQNQNLTNSNDDFLENHTQLLMQKIKNKDIQQMQVMEG